MVNTNMVIKGETPEKLSSSRKSSMEYYQEKKRLMNKLDMIGYSD